MSALNVLSRRVINSRLVTRHIRSLQHGVIKANHGFPLSKSSKTCHYQNPRYFQTSYPLLSEGNGEIVQFHLSDIGEGIKEVTIKEWFVKPGDSVMQFDQICEVQSDKASVTITSRFDGVVTKLYYEIDDLAQTGDPLVDIRVPGGSGSAVGGSSTGGAAKEMDLPEKEAVNVVERDEVGNKPLATPAVRRLAFENDVNLIDVTGTGKHGRILKEDVLNYLESSKGGVPEMAPPKKSPSPTPPPPTRAPTAPKRTPPPSVDKPVAMSGFVKAMTKAMNESIKIPHFGYNDEINMNKLVVLRKQVKKSMDLKISYMPFILKAASLSLGNHPILNSSPNFNDSTIIYKSSHNIGVAMDTPNGLVVPNIKGIQDLSIIEINEELIRLQELAYQGKLGSAELSGGTFTISNIGAIGGTYAKPVITAGQVAIGAIGKIQTVPRYDYDGNIVKTSIMNVSWTADHRVIDGATIARFSNHLIDMLQNPEKMVLYMK